MPAVARDRRAGDQAGYVIAVLRLEQAELPSGEPVDQELVDRAARRLGDVQEQKRATRPAPAREPAAKEPDYSHLISPRYSALPVRRHRQRRAKNGMVREAAERGVS